jgi:hypothetical protein
MCNACSGAYLGLSFHSLNISLLPIISCIHVILGIAQCAKSQASLRPEKAFRTSCDHFHASCKARYLSTSSLLVTNKIIRIAHLPTQKWETVPISKMEMKISLMYAVYQAPELLHHNAFS